MTYSCVLQVDESPEHYRNSTKIDCCHELTGGDEKNSCLTSLYFGAIEMSLFWSNRNVLQLDNDKLVNILKYINCHWIVHFKDYVNFILIICWFLKELGKLKYGCHLTLFSASAMEYLKLGIYKEIEFN